MTTIETSFIMMVIFTSFTIIISFSTKNFNSICNNIRQKQLEYSIGYDTNYNELKNEYDTVVKPKLTKDSPMLKKVYNPEFVLRSLGASDGISFINENINPTSDDSEN
jgi:hypothetical protein